MAHGADASAAADVSPREAVARQFLAWADVDLLWDPAHHQILFAADPLPCLD